MQQPHHLIPAERLAASVSTVTSMMIGRKFTATDKRPPARWRTAMLPIPGARPFTVALSSDRPGCAALAADMLMSDVKTIGDAEIDDFLRELLNMAAGQIKSEIAPDQALGLPKVVDNAKLFDEHAWVHHVLDSGPVHLIISLSNRIY